MHKVINENVLLRKQSSDHHVSSEETTSDQPMSETEMKQNGNDMVETSEAISELSEEDGGYCIAAQHDGLGVLVTGDGCKTAPIAGHEGGKHMTQEGTDTRSEEPACDKSDSEEKLEKYNAVVEWVESHGGFWQHQSFQYMPGAGMGVIASKDIEVRYIILCKYNYTQYTPVP